MFSFLEREKLVRFPILKLTLEIRNLLMKTLMIIQYRKSDLWSFNMMQNFILFVGVS